MATLVVKGQNLVTSIAETMKSLPRGAAHAPYPRIIPSLTPRHTRDFHSADLQMHELSCVYHTQSVPSLPTPPHWGINFFTLKDNSKMRDHGSLSSATQTGSLCRGACLSFSLPVYFPGISWADLNQAASLLGVRF